jgi:signal transduction histidine kinase
MVKRNMQFLSDIVLDMLSYSKDREPLYAPCDVGETCRKVVELLAEQASRKEVRLSVAPGDGPGEVSIDEASIRRCLINLAGNAVDACEPATGCVELGTTPADDAGNFTIYVRDNGCGMDEATQEKIFDPFFSTKGGKGTGLGMPVVRKIIEEHNGMLLLDSAPGRGTTFTIRLPVGPPASA